MPPPPHTTRSSPHANGPEWKGAYEALMREGETPNLFKLVEIAEAAILTRCDALSDSSEDETERRVMADALNNVRSMKRERLKFHDLGPLHGPNRTGDEDPASFPTSAAAAVFSAAPACYGTELLFLQDAPGDVAHLVDVRQIGPQSEREISGVCSFCGDMLLACLSDIDAEPTLVRLRAELETVFLRHVAQH